LLPLKADGYFRADLLPGNGTVEQGFGCLLVLEGSGSISFENAPTMSIERGDAVVIPFAAGAYTVTDAIGIVCRPPKAELAKLAE
jgi:mannose-6-phosphate isomerase